MKKNSWKLSALASALILTGLHAHADEEYDTEIRGTVSEVYGNKNEDMHDDEKVEDAEDTPTENDEDKEDDEGKKEDSSNTPPVILLPTNYTADAGRLLGSQCAQCHGTNGISVNKWDSIAGEDDLLNEIFEDDEPIMTAQAHGYTSEEVILIGDWLKTLKNND